MSETKLHLSSHGRTGCRHTRQARSSATMRAGGTATSSCLQTSRKCSRRRCAAAPGGNQGCRTAQSSKPCFLCALTSFRQRECSVFTATAHANLPHAPHAPRFLLFRTVWHGISLHRAAAAVPAAAAYAADAPSGAAVVAQRARLPAEADAARADPAAVIPGEHAVAAVAAASVPGLSAAPGGAAGPRRGGAGAAGGHHGCGSGSRRG